MSYDEWKPGGAMRRSLAVIPWTLLACAHAQKSAPVPAQPLVSACEARGGQACRELGWIALRGPPGAGADRAAARRFMEGCETKDVQSCADLGALYAVGRGVRKDEARACALGLADACARAGLPDPSTPRTPTAPVEPSAIAPEGVAHVDAKEAEAAIDRAEKYARYFIDRELHDRLGATRAAFEAEPPLPENELQLVQRISALRRWTVSDCLPVDVYPNQDGVPANAWVSFGIGTDGRTRSIRVARVSKDASAEAQERCIADAVARWEYPAPRVGGRVFMRVAGTGPRREVPPADHWTDDHPAFATAGYTRPAMGEPGCVQKHIRVPRTTVPKLVSFKFAIGPRGDTDRFQVVEPTDTPLELARAVEDAVKSCRWIPGTGPEGRPVPIWVILPVRFR
jgi:hypothetical protein